MRSPSPAVLVPVLGALSLAFVSLTSTACGKEAVGEPALAPAAAPASPALSPKQATADAAKWKGQTITIRGVYMQGFSQGGGPNDPWALVIADAPGVQPTVACVIPAKVVLGSKYPKITAKGTVAVDSDGSVSLTGCTYEVQE
jgi:hypothetical protein